VTLGVSSVDSDRFAHHREFQAGLAQNSGKHFASISATIDGGYRKVSDFRAENDLYSGLSAELKESGLERAGLDMERGLALQFIQSVCSMNCSEVLDRGEKQAPEGDGHAPTYVRKLQDDSQ